MQRQIVDLSTVEADRLQGITRFVKTPQQKVGIHPLQIRKLVPARIDTVIEHDPRPADDRGKERSSDGGMTRKIPEKKNRRRQQQRTHDFPRDTGSPGHLGLLIIKALPDAVTDRGRRPAPKQESGQFQQKEPHISADQRNHQ